MLWIYVNYIKYVIIKKKRINVFKKFLLVIKDILSVNGVFMMELCFDVKGGIKKYN